MIISSFPALSLSKVNQSSILTEYLQKAQIEKNRFELCIKEIELLAEQHSLPIDCLVYYENYKINDHYIKELEDFVEVNRGDKKDKLVNNKINEKSDLEVFCTYGVEIKHLPLFKYLQVANKFVSTNDWLFARREFLTAKSFESFINNADHKVSKRRRRKNNLLWWDGVLQQIKSISFEIKQEAKWKKELCKILAEEAKLYLKLGLKKSLADPQLKFYNPDLHFLIEQSMKDLSLSNNSTKQKDYETVVSKDYRKLSLIADPIISTNDSQPISSSMGKGWKEAEDQKLIALTKLYRQNFDLIAQELNYYFPSSHIRTRQACQERHRHLSHTIGSYRDTVEIIKDAERHFSHLSLTQNKRGKLVNISRVTPLSTLTRVGVKGSNVVAHASHEAAVKRATQNITRLLTPGELALRRIQRMKQIINNNANSSINSSTNASTASTPVKKK